MRRVRPHDAQGPNSRTTFFRVVTHRYTRNRCVTAAQGPNSRPIFFRVVPKSGQGAATPLLPGRTASESIAQTMGLTTQEVREQQRAYPNP